VNADRIDRWLREFQRDCPTGYLFFGFGIGLVFGAAVLALLDLLDRIGAAR
jgi:hypothetical protein